MKTLIKPALFLSVYIIIFGLSSSAISLLSSSTLQMALLFVCLAFLVFVLGLVSFGEGKKAMRVRNGNDAIRKRIIETGDDIELNLSGEFKVYKGFLFGIIVISPLLILLVLHGIAMLSIGQGIGIVETLIKYAGGLFHMIFVALSGITSSAGYFGALIGVPIMVGTAGLFYYLGGRKEELVMNSFKQRHEEIYGEQN